MSAGSTSWFALHQHYPGGLTSPAPCRQFRSFPCSGRGKPFARSRRLCAQNNANHIHTTQLLESHLGFIRRRPCAESSTKQWCSEKEAARIEYEKFSNPTTFAFLLAEHHIYTLTRSTPRHNQPTSTNPPTAQHQQGWRCVLMPSRASGHTSGCQLDIHSLYTGPSTEGGCGCPQINARPQMSPR